MTSGNKIKPVFVCEKCRFETKKRNAYEIHCLTRKHLNTDTVEIKSLLCNCGKSYKHRQSLHFHKLKCKKITDCYITPSTDALTNALSEPPVIKENTQHAVIAQLMESVEKSNETVQALTLNLANIMQHLQAQNEQNSAILKQIIIADCIYTLC